MTDGELLPIGAIIERDGVKLRHLGDGRFEPVGEALTKRFTVEDGEMTAGMCRTLEGVRDA